MIATLIAFITRVFTGAHAKWLGSPPPANKPTVYFANHTSNLDMVLLWAVLPNHIRAKTRPAAARDYWEKNAIRRYLAGSVFKAILIERKKVTRSNNPIVQLVQTLDEQTSIIIFPEGGRSATDEMMPFKSGLFHLATERPNTKFVPVFIQNLNRVMPKGEVLPIPLLCSVVFGSALVLDPAENKAAFLARAREAVINLSKS